MWGIMENINTVFDNSMLSSIILEYKGEKFELLSKNNLPKDDLSEDTITVYITTAEGLEYGARSFISPRKI